MESIFANRFKLARTMAGLSLQQLSDKLENVVSKQALSKYEKGKMLPSGDVLINLSKAMDVSVDFFFTSPAVNVQLKNIEYRKRANFSKTQQEAIKNKTIDFLERYFELESALNCKEDFTIKLSNRNISSGDQVEAAAEELRKKLKLGTAPITSVYELLEDNGCKVFEVDTIKKFDGLNADANGSPVIVVNKNFSRVRRRLTALHELAHYILKFSESMSEKEQEYACHRFAAAMLFPKSRFFEEVSSNRAHFLLSELKLLKEYWGISIKAIIVRAKTLGIINDYVYKSLMIEYSRRLYNQDEPGEYCHDEKAIRFRQLLYRGIAEELITVNEAASFANKKIADFREEIELMR
jgi:Zn-dependent peptidase ImmA (M78 family)/DNA-binding XRE family transcriptional regulator